MSVMQYMLPLIVAAFLLAHALEGNLLGYLLCMGFVTAIGFVCAGVAIAAWWLVALIANKGDWTRIPR